MAIRFDSGYNKSIRSIVANYNQRRKRMIAAGYKHVPAPAKVSDLKARYETRSDLNKELNRLKNLGRGDVLKKIENEGGVKAVDWEFKYAKTNLKNAREYFSREYERVAKRVGKFPGERQYLDAIQAKMNVLDMDINYMNQSQFNSAISAINEFAKSPSKRRAEYRGFLSEVDMVMERLGYSSEQRNQILNKFNKLTPSQFLYAYDKSDIIGRVYELADSPKPGEGIVLNESEEKAQEIIDSLGEQVDDIVLDAQLNMD